MELSQAEETLSSCQYLTTEHPILLQRDWWKDGVQVAEGNFVGDEGYACVVFLQDGASFYGGRARQLKDCGEDMHQDLHSRTTCGVGWPE